MKKAATRFARRREPRACGARTLRSLGFVEILSVRNIWTSVSVNTEVTSIENDPVRRIQTIPANQRAV